MAASPTSTNVPDMSALLGGGLDSTSLLQLVGSLSVEDAAEFEKLLEAQELMRKQNEMELLELGKVKAAQEEQMLAIDKLPPEALESLLKDIQKSQSSTTDVDLISRLAAIKAEQEATGLAEKVLADEQKKHEEQSQNAQMLLTQATSGFNAQQQQLQTLQQQQLTATNQQLNQQLLLTQNTLQQQAQQQQQLLQLQQQKELEQMQLQTQQVQQQQQQAVQLATLAQQQVQMMALKVAQETNAQQQQLYTAQLQLNLAAQQQAQQQQQQRAQELLLAQAQIQAQQEKHKQAQQQLQQTQQQQIQQQLNQQRVQFVLQQQQQQLQQQQQQQQLAMRVKAQMEQALQAQQLQRQQLLQQQMQERLRQQQQQALAHLQSKMQQPQQHLIQQINTNPQQQTAHQQLIALMQTQMNSNPLMTNTQQPQQHMNQQLIALLQARQRQQQQQQQLQQQQVNPNILMTNPQQLTPQQQLQAMIMTNTNSPTNTNHSPTATVIPINTNITATVTPIAGSGTGTPTATVTPITDAVTVIPVTATATPTPSTVVTTTTTKPRHQVILSLPENWKKKGIPQFIPGGILLYNFKNNSGEQEVIERHYYLGHNLEKRTEGKSEFIVQLRNSKSKKVVFKLKFDSEDKQSQWIEAIVQSIGNKLPASTVIQSPDGGLMSVTGSGGANVPSGASSNSLGINETPNEDPQPSPHKERGSLLPSIIKPAKLTRDSNGSSFSESTSETIEVVKEKEKDKKKGDKESKTTVVDGETPSEDSKDSKKKDKDKDKIKVTGGDVVEDKADVKVSVTTDKDAGRIDEEGEKGTSKTKLKKDETKKNYNQWYWLDGGTPTAYDIRTNAEIQNAYAAKKKDVCITLANGGQYRIVFKTKLQINEKTGVGRNVTCDDEKNKTPIKVVSKAEAEASASSGAKEEKEKPKKDKKGDKPEKETKEIKKKKDKEDKEKPKDAKETKKKEDKDKKDTKQADEDKSSPTSTNTSTTNSSNNPTNSSNTIISTAVPTETPSSALATTTTTTLSQSTGKFGPNEEWSYFNGDAFVPLAKEIIAVINQQVAAGKLDFKLKIKGTGTVHYELDILYSTTELKKDKKDIKVLSCPSVEQKMKNLPSWNPEFPPRAGPSEPNLTLQTLLPTDQEFIHVKELFEVTMKKEIVSIQKVINHRIKESFKLELGHVKEKNNNDPTIEYTKLLWHGSKGTDPHIIYNGEKGFMINFASDGYWGKGIYFAEKACYSHHYTHICKDNPNHRQLFLSEVMVGQSVVLKPDRTLKVPPEKPAKASGQNIAIERYDSVEGVTGGSRVWIVYDNNKAYPSYLLTYNSPQKEKEKD